jgi:hypothetical protein
VIAPVCRRPRAGASPPQPRRRSNSTLSARRSCPKAPVSCPRVDRAGRRAEPAVARRPGGDPAARRERRGHRPRSPGPERRLGGALSRHLVARHLRQPAGHAAGRAHHAQGARPDAGPAHGYRARDRADGAFRAHRDPRAGMPLSRRQPVLGRLRAYPRASTPGATRCSTGGWWRRPRRSARWSIRVTTSGC